MNRIEKQSIEFIRSQVEPEIIEVEDGPWDLYGPLIKFKAYKQGFAGPIPYHQDGVDAYRVSLIGA